MEVISIITLCITCGVIGYHLGKDVKDLDNKNNRQ